MIKEFKSILKPIFNGILGCFYLAQFVFFKEKKIKSAENVFFFPYYHLGGAERVHVAILKAMKDQKCTIVFTHGSATKSFYEEFKSYGSVIELNPILNKKFRWVNNKLQNKIVQIINSSKSVKTIFGCNTDYYYSILPQIKETIIKNDLFHNFVENDHREDAIVNSAIIITNRIVINEVARQDILTFYLKNKVDSSYHSKLQIIENGITFDEAVFDGKEEDNFKIGFIGRWCEQKQPLVFLEIAKKVKSKYPSISFVMAGSGMKSNLDIIVASGVVFLGEINDKTILDKLYKELQFVLLPSLYEGFPMTIMESMAYGVIPITTNVGGISDHIFNNENGILIECVVKEQMIDDFVFEIEKMILDKKQREIISKNAFEYSRANFGIEKFNESYRNLF